MSTHATLDRQAQPVGCGALRRIDSVTGELKRMYVVPEARGQRVGKAILIGLQEQARSLGMTTLLLETGERSREAVSMYERAGFTRIECFGEYANSPLSLCMRKDLRP